MGLNYKLFPVLAAGVILILVSCMTTEKAKAGSAGEPVVESNKPQVVNKLAGTWTFEDGEFGGMIIIFGEDNRITMSGDDGSFQVTGTYIADYNSDPILLDIQWPEAGTAKTIIRFIDDNKLQIENNELDTERPGFFSDNSELFIRVE